MTTVPNFPALPDTKDISGADMPVPLTGDADYRASIHKARGNTRFSVKDYGAVGDGATDDRVAIQACLDDAAASTREACIYFPRGDYRVSSSGSGYALALPDKFHILGEGGSFQLNDSASVITLTSSTASDALFRLTNVQADNYDGSSVEMIQFRALNGDSVNNLHCFTLGVGNNANWKHNYLAHVHFNGFSGACFWIQNSVTNQEFCGYAMFHHCSVANCGAFLDQDAPIGTVALGTGVTINEMRVQGWNDQSPSANFFNFHDVREVIINNMVIEGGAIPAGRNAFFFFGGDAWYILKGVHFETSTYPTYSVDCNNNLNATATRAIYLREGRFFRNGMKYRPAQYSVTYLEGVSGYTDGDLSASFIDTAQAGNGAWSLTFDRSQPFEISPDHVGHINARSFTKNTIPTEVPIVLNTIDFQAGRDGWFSGLVSAGVGDNLKQGGHTLQAYLDASTYDEIGIVDDPEEGRVFAFRGTIAPDFEVQSNVPTEFVGSSPETSIIFYTSMRVKMIYAGSSYRQLWFNSGGAGIGGFSLNSDQTPPVVDTWQTIIFSVGLDAAQHTVRNVGSGTPSETMECRLASFRAGFGAEYYPIGLGGGYFTSNANQQRPIRWWNDAPPTWGDYKLGDRVDNCLPSVGSPQGWVCTTAGGLATAWAPSTAYIVGDWVENDSGKIYKCVTSGTSAGGGGPTGTGSSIADNTAVWDYHSAQATFTALANI